MKDSYALPRIEQTLESLADSMVYSTLDLTSGYWQVEMAEECKQYTAFTCGPLGFLSVRPCHLEPQMLLQPFKGSWKIAWEI